MEIDARVIETSAQTRLIKNANVYISDLTEGCNRCPLCHENIEDEEFSWKIHLMGEKPCSKNTRIKISQKQVKIQV